MYIIRVCLSCTTQNEGLHLQYLVELKSTLLDSTGFWRHQTKSNTSGIVNGNDILLNTSRNNETKPCYVTVDRYRVSTICVVIKEFQVNNPLNIS